MSAPPSKKNKTNPSSTRPVITVAAASNSVANRGRQGTVEQLELKPHAGNSNRRIPDRFQYKSIRNLMTEQNTMCAKVAGRLLRGINADKNNSKTNFTNK